MTLVSEGRWGVVGAGAIGCALAARLSSSGRDVTLAARGAKLKALKAQGLRLTEGGQTIQAWPKIASLDELGPVDRLVLAVKAQDLPGLASDLPALMHDQTVVVPMVNGLPWWYFLGEGGAHDGSAIQAVDPGGCLRDAIPADKIAGCVVYTTSLLEGLGDVRVAVRQHLSLGRLSASGGVDVEALAADLNDAGVHTAVSSQIRDEVWTKAAMNLSVNPLSVASGASLGAHFSNPNLLAVVTDILNECWAVANLYGAKPTMTMEHILSIGRQPAALQHRTSMQNDFRDGRALELPAIYGAIEELAERVGRALPVGGAVVELAKYLASNREYAIL